ncbi:PREDICTED: C-type lectin domain family 2 member B-like, partial [Tinamus guttatus]
PDAWLGFQGRCYYFSSNESDWDSSRANCESMGASLASIHSPDEL